MKLHKVTHKLIGKIELDSCDSSLELFQKDQLVQELEVMGDRNYIYTSGINGCVIDTLTIVGDFNRIKNFSVRNLFLHGNENELIDCHYDIKDDSGYYNVINGVIDEGPANHIYDPS